jgi:hypothetical protein
VAFGKRMLEVAMNSIDMSDQGCARMVVEAWSSRGHGMRMRRWPTPGILSECLPDGSGLHLMIDA